MSTTASRITVYDSQKIQHLPGYLVKVVQELKIYRYAYFNFINNTLSNRYRRSVLGFFWTLVSPLINLTILAVVFSIVFKQDLRIFGVYVFSALLPWNFIAACLNQSATVFISAENYLKKVYMPKFLFPLTLVSVEGINFFFSLISIYIILLFMGAPLHWVMLLTPLPMLITFVFVLGWVMLISVAHLYFRDMAHIVQVVVSALMFTIPIMYPMDTIPPRYQFIFAINPFYHFINLFRIVLYEARLPLWFEWGLPTGIALLSFLLGLYVLMKQELDLVFRL